MSPNDPTWPNDPMPRNDPSFASLQCDKNGMRFLWLLEASYSEIVPFPSQPSSCLCTFFMIGLSWYPHNALLDTFIIDEHYKPPKVYVSEDVEKWHVFQNNWLLAFDLRKYVG